MGVVCCVALQNCSCLQAVAVDIAVDEAAREKSGRVVWNHTKVTRRTPMQIMYGKWEPGQLRERALAHVNALVAKRNEQ